MPFIENLSDFINPDTPGYVVAQIAGNDVSGIFVNEFAGANLGMAGFESTSPFFHAATADLANIAQGNDVVIGSVTYKAGSIEPDGTGMTMLQLKK